MSQRTKRVLVVDGNQDLLEMLSTLLRIRGYEVEAARDSVAAMARFAAFSPEVAILDIEMAGTDGSDLARDMCALQACRLIAVSGDARPSDRAKSVEAGFAAYLLKPLKLEALLAAIESGERS